jgi:hypothetical protein
MKLMVDPPPSLDQSLIFQIGDEELRDRVRSLVTWAEAHIRICHFAQTEDSHKGFDPGRVFKATSERQILEFVLGLLRGDV